MNAGTSADQTFAGSIPETYDRYLVPLIFEPYALDLAARLARATVAGSGELLHRSPLEAATLRQNVTSPNGTTAAALAILMAADGLDPMMEKAVAAATKRSRELAG